MKILRTTTTYIVLVVAAVLAIFFFYQTRTLKDELEVTTESAREAKNQAAFYEELAAMDSLLIQGNYTSALQAYNAQLEDSLLVDSSAVELRIRLAERLITFNNQLNTSDTGIYTELLARIDSMRDRQRATPEEIRQYDSISFALNKAQLQLKNMRQRLNDVSSGRYLTFTTSKGSEVHYVGEVEHDMANGDGVGLLSTGSRYVGEWKDNQRHGEGIFHWPDGEYYEGEFREDKREGQGTYYWPNGEKFVGEWKDDERNGEGTFYSPEGDVVASGQWKDNELVEVEK